MEKFKDFSRLRTQIKNCFDDIKIQSCFIDRNYNLVIKLENEQQKEAILSKLAQDTNRKFFDEGLEQIFKIPKYFFAIHNVDTSIDVDTYKDVLATKYKITELTRMTKKSSNEPLRTIKAATSDLNTYNEIINEGRIKIYYSSLKVSKWNFTENADQCFKCLSFGHHSSNCQFKGTRCLRCAGTDHTHNTCSVTDPSHYKCFNCKGQHAACSKSCQMIQDRIEQKNKLIDKHILRNSGLTTRISSTNQNNTAQSTLPLVENYMSEQFFKFICLIMDILRNLNAIVDELEQNSGDTLINLINTHLGSALARKIEILFETDRSITNDMDHAQ